MSDVDNFKGEGNAYNTNGFILDEHLVAPKCSHRASFHSLGMQVSANMGHEELVVLARDVDLQV